MDAEQLFWRCADKLYAIDGVAEGTIFGFRCLRVDGGFVALPANDQLWVKLDETRVSELLEQGLGEECRPNGRVFRAWLAVSIIDEHLWMDLLIESIEIVRP